jgi:membrane protease YdiL (CAAX protease family)
MTSLMFLAVFIFIYFDLYILRKRDVELYEDVFFFTPKVFNIFIFFVVCLAIFAERKIDVFTFFSLFGVGPIYLIRRWRFLNQLNTDESVEEGETGKLKMLTESCSLIIVWFLSLFVAALCVRFVLHLLRVEDEAKIIELLLSSACSSAILFILIYRLAKKAGVDFLSYVSLRRNTQARWKVFVLPALLGMGFAFISTWIVAERKIQPNTPLGDLMGTIQSSWIILIFIVLAILIAPFIEELVFRGYFYKIIEKTKGKIFAIISISFIFAFLHVSQYWGDWMAIVVVGILGLVLTSIRAWTGTTLSSVTMHYVYNAGVTILPIFMLMTSNPAYFKYEMYYDRLSPDMKESLLKESLQKDPQLADAYKDLAWLYAQENKDLNRALSFADQALALNGQNEEYLEAKAVILEKMGRKDEAAALRKKLESE